MNILTVNLILSTVVFWIAASIYVVPKIPEVRRRQSCCRSFFCIRFGTLV